MNGMTGLVLAIAPLTVLAAVSPVIFLNASTVASNGGRDALARFAGGNLFVLVVVGASSMGLLGAQAAGLAARELASRAANITLATVLLGYGAWLVVGYRRRHSGRRAGAPIPAPAPPEPAPPAAPTASRPVARGLFGWGVIGMATNVTTLPLLVSVSQRIGLAQVAAVLKVLVLAVVLAVVLTPAWLPGLFLAVAPDRVEVSQSARLGVARWTTLASIAACALGGAFLIWRAV